MAIPLGYISGKEQSMKVKSIDIARELGLSKATVSMALNNKPGVSEKTRKVVFECRERLANGEHYVILPEKDEKTSVSAQRMIRVVTVSNHKEAYRIHELDLWTNVQSVFDRGARERGYILGLTYFVIGQDSVEELTADCNSKLVAGVIVMGTELAPEHAKLFRDIQKPLVMYDCDLECDVYPYVLADNRGGVKKAVRYLMENGLRDIHYLANTIRIYNFEERRRGFLEAMEAHVVSRAEENIHYLGSTIEENCSNFRRRLQTKLPQAFIMENYQVSIGVMRALREADIQIPQEVSLIGIDELPSYLTSGWELTAIRIPHAERACWVMEMLFQEMHRMSETKSKLYTNCRLVKGNTVKLLHSV